MAFKWAFSALTDGIFTVPVLDIMRTDYELNERSVKIFRALYYDQFKLLVKDGLQLKDIRAIMKSRLDEVGWTWRQFEDFISIDLMQRFVFDYSHSLVISGHRGKPFTSKRDYRQYDPNYGALRLKDNNRSEDPDKISN